MRFGAIKRGGAAILGVRWPGGRMGSDEGGRRTDDDILMRS